MLIAELFIESLCNVRRKITEYCNQEAKKLNGELELDESYFGGKRKGNRGGANNKSIAFRILEIKNKDYNIIVENVRADTIMKAIKLRTKKGSVFYTDGFKSYANLKQYRKHNVIRHDKEFAK